MDIRVMYILLYYLNRGIYRCMFFIFMYEGPTADELCSVGWYIHVCMFLNCIDFVRCCIYLYPR